MFALESDLTPGQQQVLQRCHEQGSGWGLWEDTKPSSVPLAPSLTMSICNPKELVNPCPSLGPHIRASVSPATSATVSAGPRRYFLPQLSGGKLWVHFSETVTLSTALFQIKSWIHFFPHGLMHTFFWQGSELQRLSRIRQYFLNWAAVYSWSLFLKEALLTHHKILHFAYAYFSFQQQW